MQSRFYVSNFCQALRRLALDTQEVTLTVAQAENGLGAENVDTLSAKEIYENYRRDIVREDDEAIGNFISYLLSDNKGLVQTLLTDNANSSMMWEEILTEDYDGNEDIIDK